MVAAVFLGYTCGGRDSLIKPTHKRPQPHSLRLAAEDGGQSWKREKAADELAANLYELVFTPGGLGFVLGNDGVLLRVGAGAAA